MVISASYLRISRIKQDIIMHLSCMTYDPSSCRYNCYLLNVALYRPPVYRPPVYIPLILEDHLRREAWSMHVQVQVWSRTQA